MNLFRRNRLPYSQEDIAIHLGSISDLIKQREKAMQLATVHQRSNVKQQRYLEEVDRVDDMIKHAQLALEFMFKKNLKRHKDNQ